MKSPMLIQQHTHVKKISIVIGAQNAVLYVEGLVNVIPALNEIFLLYRSMDWTSVRISFQNKHLLSQARSTFNVLLALI